MRGINHQNIFEDAEDNYQFINTLDRMRVRYDDDGNPCGSNCTEERGDGYQEDPSVEERVEQTAAEIQVYVEQPSLPDSLTT